MYRVEAYKQLQVHTRGDSWKKWNRAESGQLALALPMLLNITLGYICDRIQSY